MTPEPEKQWQAVCKEHQHQTLKRATHGPFFQRREISLASQRLKIALWIRA